VRRAGGDLRHCSAGRLPGSGISGLARLADRRALADARGRHVFLARVLAEQQVVEDAACNRRRRASAPKPAFSTITASATVGASIGAAAMYSEWSRLCSSSLAALYFSFWRIADGLGRAGLAAAAVGAPAKTRARCLPG
jgi:hypothetical protein